MSKYKKSTIIVLVVMLFMMVFPLMVHASGDVSTAIESTWKDASKQIKDVVDKVVFPAVDLVLAVLFFVNLAMSYFEYKKHGSFEFTGPAILFFGLVFSLTAPLYIWKILGI